MFQAHEDILDDQQIFLSKSSNNLLLYLVHADICRFQQSTDLREFRWLYQSQILQEWNISRESARIMPKPSNNRLLLFENPLRKIMLSNPEAITARIFAIIRLLLESSQRTFWPMQAINKLEHTFLLISGLFPNTSQNSAYLLWISMPILTENALNANPFPQRWRFPAV